MYKPYSDIVKHLNSDDHFSFVEVNHSLISHQEEGIWFFFLDVIQELLYKDVLYTDDIYLETFLQELFDKKSLKDKKDFVKQLACKRKFANLDVIRVIAHETLHAYIGLEERWNRETFRLLLQLVTINDKLTSIDLLAEVLDRSLDFKSLSEESEQWIYIVKNALTKEEKLARWQVVNIPADVLELLVLIKSINKETKDI